MNRSRRDTLVTLLIEEKNAVLCGYDVTKDIQQKLKDNYGCAAFDTLRAVFEGELSLQVSLYLIIFIAKEYSSELALKEWIDIVKTLAADRGKDDQVVLLEHLGYHFPDWKLP